MNVRFDVNQMRAAKCAQVPQIHRYERLIIPRACRLWQIAERFNYTRVVTAVNAFVVNSFAKRITRPVEIHQIYAKFINYLRDRDQTNISNEQLSKWTFAWTVLIVSIASFEETRIGLGSIKKHERKIRPRGRGAIERSRSPALRIHSVSFKALFQNAV